MLPANEMSTNIPTGLKEICPPLTCMGDFFQYWSQTLAQLNAFGAHVEITKRERSYGGLCLQELTFRSFNNAIIHGYLLTPESVESGPLIVYTHGYMGSCDILWSWAKQGASVFGVDIRGFGKSRNAINDISPHGYVLTGVESETTSILRGAICDYIRAVQVARELLQNRQQATVLYGRSFGGALASIAAGLTQYADILVSAVPTFAWAEGRRELVTQGSGAEINSYLKKFPEAEAEVMHVLSYFDTMNFAPMIKSQALIGVGLKDPVVPAETVYAFINHLSCPVEIRHYPVSHTCLPEEILWDGFQDEWLQLALNAQKESSPPHITKTIGR